MPAVLISQVISAIPVAGKRGVDTQTTFVTKQEAFQDALVGTTVTQLNALGTQANALATQANVDATTATNQAVIATTQASNATTAMNTAYATANFKGAWNSTTDFANSSCEYLGLIYVSKVAPNINNLPTDTASWAPLTKALVLDTIPTIGSTNAITSGAVALATVGSTLYLYTYGGF